MRLANWCALGSMALLLLGFVPIVFVQLELASPGVEVFEGRIALFDAAVQGHGLILATSAPLAAAALGFAITGEARRKTARFWTSLSILALGFGLLSAIASLGMIVSGFSIGKGIADLAAIPSAFFLLLSATVVAVTGKGVRAVPLFLWLSIPAFFGAGLLMVVLSNTGVDASVHDTYFTLAPIHAIGASVILLTLSIFEAYLGGERSKPGPWFGVMFGALILAAGGLTALYNATLGLQGFPRRYVDYPALFADGQLKLAMSAALLALVTAAAFGCLAIIRLTSRNSD